MCTGDLLKSICGPKSICGTLLAAAGFFVVAGCASHKPVAPTDVPPALKVPDGEVLTAALHGTGVQIYECRASTQDQNRFSWVLEAPAADLSDRSGKDVGHHYGGPTWEGEDGSKVVGEVLAHDKGPDPSAIPWLLLKAKSTSGNGIFARTRFIQRLHTVGGLAPTALCDAGHAGQRSRVAYSADYYFYAAPGAP
ncbi:MAG TPA: DUF3455 domain-containing protein [Steroidobacteraceae bacterium]|jgi:hypothetical protein|nr:DUF3455 domain-containing protein [Steroidobacteraceae bacterium]